MNTCQLIKMIDKWKNNSWLSGMSFDYPTEILSQALVEFHFDYNRWFPDHQYIDEKYLELTPQLISLLLYRISRLLFLKGDSEDISKDLFSLLARHIGQIKIYYSAEIGKAFKINHGVGSVIGARCKIGDNCTIHQNCTIGDRKGGRPHIGNNVTIYSGAIILGDIEIGDNSIIGANSLVIHDCKHNSVMVGNPAKCVRIL